nr:MAG TPA_asm: hypothetical protein [Bacteriophage sp.]
MRQSCSLKKIKLRWKGNSLKLEPPSAIKQTRKLLEVSDYEVRQ